MPLHGKSFGFQILGNQVAQVMTVFRKKYAFAHLAAFIKNTLDVSGADRKKTNPSSYKLIIPDLKE
jgi:hypothetical protein